MVLLAALCMQSLTGTCHNVIFHGPPGPAGSAAGSAVGFWIRRPYTSLFDLLLCTEVARTIAYTPVLSAALSRKALTWTCQKVRFQDPPGPAGSAAGSAVGFEIRRPYTSLSELILCTEVA